ncbi:multisubunit sodium/proton antiporter, MrpC subunit [Tindallia magadiensis]|uniref:Multisubunit sodium/proton antiporter, MrpC subunit n=1 Tax=Tindallia magadiensis TaxID=69895 RepID=A0A1I3F9J5_9FIRM|nr:cation:proton antiporter subunit C [Tindallia magadiensis]SFI07858.1 multisubunit sodium/proton antiporter, MrpC subunit [Tindallia magadiensis]
MQIQFFLQNINYIGSSCLFVIGLYTVLTHPNLIKKIIGINIMETSVFLFFVSIGFVQGGSAPIIKASGNEAIHYVNPLPSALILTGIVVAVSITVYGLSMIIKIYDAYGTIELDEIMQIRSGKVND